MVANVAVATTTSPCVSPSWGEGQAECFAGCFAEFHESSKRANHRAQRIQENRRIGEFGMVELDCRWPALGSLSVLHLVWNSLCSLCLCGSLISRANVLVDLRTQLVHDDEFRIERRMKKNRAQLA